MIFHVVDVEMNGDDNAASARTIFNFFVFQYERAHEHYANARGNYEGAIEANKIAKLVHNEEESMGGLGCGSFALSLPYEPHHIEQRRLEMEKAKKDLADAKRLLAFVRERFVEKFI